MNYKYSLTINELSNLNYMLLLDYISHEANAKIVGLGSITHNPKVYHEVYIGINTEDALFGLEKLLKQDEVKENGK